MIFLEQIVKLKEKNNFVLISSLIALGVISLSFLLLWLGNSNNIVGVQLLTSKGTVLIGRSKYSKKLTAWASPQIGLLAKDGKAHFFYIKHKKDKASQKNWEIIWEWDELYKIGEKDPLMRFVPTQEEKDASIETLSSLCGNKKEITLSCQWSISNRIFIEALTNEYMCLSDLASEFYGGAHPLALRRFGSFDLKKKKFVRFDELISDNQVKDLIWSQLYENIKVVLEQSLIGEGSVGGVDIIAPSEDLSNEENNNPPEQKLTSLLGSQGYAFSPNVFCPIVRPEGPFLLFGFPHSEQVNRGLNFKAEALLNQPQLPKKVLKLFSDYRFTKATNDESTKMLSPSSKWQIKQKLNEVQVSYDSKRLTLVLPESEEASEELIGIFWIYKSPNLTTLNKHKFKPIKLSKLQTQIDLNKVL